MEAQAATGELGGWAEVTALGVPWLLQSGLGEMGVQLEQGRRQGHPEP